MQSTNRSGDEVGESLLCGPESEFRLERKRGKKDKGKYMGWGKKINKKKGKSGIKSREPKGSLQPCPEKPGADATHPAGVPGEPPEAGSFFRPRNGDISYAYRIMLQRCLFVAVRETVTSR